MKRAVLFLHGRYRQADLQFFTPLCRGAYRVAVDGGLSFFRRSKSTPDLLLGDFDSLARVPKNLPKTTRVIRVEVRKDQTDTELALLHCLEDGYREIDIVQPGIGDLDHLVGNVMLLRLVGRKYEKAARFPRVRLVSRTEEIRYLYDSAVMIRDAAGCRVSLVPLSRQVVYSCTGTDYPARRLRLKPGDTRGLRNRITAQTARFSVEGEALLIRQFGAA